MKKDRVSAGDLQPHVASPDLSILKADIQWRSAGDPAEMLLIAAPLDPKLAVVGSENQLARLEEHFDLYFRHYRDYVRLYERQRRN